MKMSFRPYPTYTNKRHNGQVCGIQHNQSYLLKGKKMKRIIVVMLVVIMLAVSVVPAFAAGGPPPDRGTGTGICDGTQIRAGGGAQARVGVSTPYALSGTITEIDAAAEAINVTVACGNTLVRAYITKNVILQTRETTRFLLRNEAGTASLITFEDLKIGDQISSHGRLVDGTFAAARVTDGALLSCLS
jgi:hypothetical protein